MGEQFGNGKAIHLGGNVYKASDSGADSCVGVGPLLNEAGVITDVDFVDTKDPTFQTKIPMSREDFIAICMGARNGEFDFFRVEDNSTEG